MGTVGATFIGGKIVPDAPPGWPEGTRLVVEPDGPAGQTPPDRPDRLVMLTDEEDQGTDPESIARWLAWYDSLEPLVMSPEDEERIRKARADQKAFELSKWEEHGAKLEKLFE